MIFKTDIAPYYRDSRPCFAKEEYRGHLYCTLLVDTYQKDGQCPFCKGDRNEDKTLHDTPGSG